MPTTTHRTERGLRDYLARDARRRLEVVCDGGRIVSAGTYLTDDSEPPRIVDIRHARCALSCGCVAKVGGDEDHADYAHRYVVNPEQWRRGQQKIAMEKWRRKNRKSSVVYATQYRRDHPEQCTASRKAREARNRNLPDIEDKRTACAAHPGIRYEPTRRRYEAAVGRQKVGFHETLEEAVEARCWGLWYISNHPENNGPLTKMYRAWQQDQAKQ